jgi:hypothetical protein
MLPLVWSLMLELACLIRCQVLGGAALGMQSQQQCTTKRPPEVDARPV